VDRWLAIALSKLRHYKEQNRSDKNLPLREDGDVESPLHE